MNDVWLAPGLTRREFETFLHALALRDKPYPPLLAVSRGTDETATLVMASRALFRLFDVKGEDGLAARLLDGRDPGAKRLAILARTMPLEGAPRLERLRFFIGEGSEFITFLCRRLTSESGLPVFVAAALGVRPGLIPSDMQDPVGHVPRSVPPADANAPHGAQAIQANLRARWPTSRTVRFLWRTDADSICTMVTPPLADIVGAANGDLVGRDFQDLAAAVDPTGRLATALAGRVTWSGLDVSWPVADEPAGINVGLGGIPAFRDQVFDGFSGYGVIHLDQIASRDPARLGPDSAPAPDNVVPFRGKALSPEDQIAFDALGMELRDHVGIPTPPAFEPDTGGMHPILALSGPTTPPLAATAIDAPLVVVETKVAEKTVADTIVAEAIADAAPTTEAEPIPGDLVAPSEAEPPKVAPPVAPVDARAADVERNGLAALDKLAVGLLVSRDNIPIFANRHLLDQLGFANEDALHDAGGMAHLFGGQPGNVSGSEAVGLRAADGTIIPSNARMQRITWNGLPATLLTLQAATARPASATPMMAEPGPAEKATPRQDQSADEARELRAILETATDGVAVLGVDGNILSLNRSGEALFGCDRTQVIGKPFLDLFAAHNQNLAAEYFEGLKSSATRSLLNDGRELLIKARQGGTIPVFMTLGRLGATSEPTEQPARFCALFRDLTHWKKVEQELGTAKKDAERSSALKTDFLAKVSHEIRTPLNAIIGFAEVIMEERLGPIGTARYKEYLRDIHGAGTHVMSLVNDLLDLSKIESGKMELAVDSVDANKVISECVAIMQPQASRERVIMRLSLASKLPRIQADERSLRQIVLNLLSNAVKFNEPGGQVIVATALTEAGEAVIRIRDTGPGMSEADIVTALEPFRQLSSDPKGGTGLGLPLTKALVEANRASFSVKSKVDQGTLVEVAFPPARDLAR